MKQLLLALCLFIGMSAQAQPNATWKWAQPVSDFNGVMDIATDAAGYYYVTGRVAGTLQLGKTQLTSPGSLSVYVAKCRPSGEVVWATQLPCSANALGTSVQVDAQGNSYVAGYFQGTLSYGNNQQVTAQTPDGGNTAFLLKCSSAGQVQWVQQISASGTELYGTCEAWAVAVDLAGNAYLTGQASGSQVHIGALAFANRERQTYLASYTPQGTVRWAQMWQSVASYGGNRGWGVSVDNFGNCYLSGNQFGGMQLAGQSIPANSSYSLFLAKFDARQGQLQWLQAPAANGNGNSLATDNQGNVYLAGSFSGTSTFGSKILTSHGDADAVVVRYNRDGRVGWATAVGGTNGDYDGDLAVDKATGKVFMSGVANFTSQSTNQSFVVQLQPNGKAFEPTLVSGPGTSSSTALAIDRNNTIFTAGVFTGSCRFGTDALNSTFTSGYLASFGASNARNRITESNATLAATSVYPNPAREQFTLRLEGYDAQPARAVLLNQLGRRVAEQTLQLAGAVTETTFNTANLPTGVYILRVEHGQQVTTRAVTVQ
ncbi:T9SS type A sorting domain-containing protein [Solirubrum puertoriconensis]|uniref:Secretion system C-terminal sorting domain-containing protein n=1 Tax=Solirubrum puertoriconensis TaxID=1751427 RepID=A0A9X0HIY9_SOLP1|nr:T9SS type A sorting domain-containing protein [Solirubrum puertoriconensis]KUG06734.1 hypothetical protein ASU33_05205 [Solirubrum puertoriconensis]